ncbi:ATP-binding protein [Sporolactobacillus shoreicorticis]|uniref:ATP-binding protein n=1 Tax=Sporolactobacillus shoreicorticis TaxID=1923877 RepID=A0ABW5RYL2_9BACL|nr:ATP-binding protein [Sporolactobacillus shoreicorticis]MCO7125160.1 ATP-binding protein [Sporolactobacillus shoreicorticis]
MTQIVFISGIHGSGKTTLGKKISEEINIPFDSASNIIKTVSSQNWDKYKKVTDISGNQSKLAKGIAELYANDNILILDGHFCLLDKDNEVIEIDLKTFQEIHIKLIICCTANYHTISKRLSERDQNYKVDLEQIKLFQEKEIEHATEVSNQLNVPIIFFDAEKNNEGELLNNIKIIGGI